MTETLLILATTFILMMVAFYVVEKWWAKRSNKASAQPENPKKTYKAFLKFYMPSGWYCEFWKGDTKCFGVLDLPKEEHQNGEVCEARIKGFSDKYELEIA